MQPFQIGNICSCDRSHAYPFYVEAISAEADHRDDETWAEEQAEGAAAAAEAEAEWDEIEAA